jgi:glycosyltransferase involved in cell wall biosynthesis
MTTPSAQHQQPRPRAPRLAYLVSRYPAVSHTFILREVQGLRELGAQVCVASVNPPDRDRSRMTDDEREEDAATYCLKRDGVTGALAALAWAAFNNPVALAATLVHATRLATGLRRVYALAYAVEALMVARWMNSLALKHLHVHFGTAAANVGVLVKRFSGAGLSLTIHGPDEFDDVPGQNLVHKIEQADHVICISQFGRSQLMRLTAPLHWAKMKVCRLGVDPLQFTPSLPRTDPARQGRPVTRLLSVGRLTPAKGQLLLVQACATLHQAGIRFALTIVGDGPDRVRLMQAVADSGLGEMIQLTGSLNTCEVRDQMARADVFVLPSLAEGIPVVLMEAMACAVPCVTCPVNGIPELVVNDRNGLLVTPGDVDSLAAALRRLIEDPALRERLAGAARDKVRTEYNLQRNVRSLFGLMAAMPTAMGLSAAPERADTSALPA